MTKKIRAAAYLRNSTTEQVDSAAQQRQAITAYAEKHNYELVETYHDDGISGLNSATSKRTGFQDMVAAAEQRKFSVVIVWEYSRVTRSSPFQAVAELLPLLNTGAKIACTDRDGLLSSDDMISFLNLGLKSHSANEYIRSLSRSVLRGMIDVAKRGEWVAGPSPFGYSVDPDTRKLVPNDDAKWVKHIFNLYMAGKSYRYIVADLKSNGVAKNTSAVGKILHREVYCGTMTFNRYSKGKMHSYRDGQVTADVQHGDNARKDQIVVHGAHEAIIDRETFNLIAQRAAERQKFGVSGSNGKRKLHPTTGITFCADCGGKMSVLRSEKYGDKMRCGSYIDTNECRLNTVRLDEVVAKMLDYIDGALKDGSLATQLSQAASVVAGEMDMNNHIRETEGALEAAQEELSALKERLLVVDADLVELFSDKLRQAKEKVERYTIAFEDHQIAEAYDPAEEVEGKLEAYRKLRSHFDVSDPAEVREHLHSLVDQLIVHAGHKPHGTGGRVKYHLEDVTITTTDGITLGKDS